MVAGNLNVKLRKAKLKRDTEFFGSMDPYVMITIGNVHQWKSQVIKDGGVRPNFHNESAQFLLHDHENKIPFIKFQIFDKESLKSKDDLVCEGTFELNQLLQYKTREYDGDVKLFYSGKDAGTLDIFLKLHEFENQEEHKKAENVAQVNPFQNQINQAMP